MRLLKTNLKLPTPKKSTKMKNSEKETPPKSETLDNDLTMYRNQANYILGEYPNDLEIHDKPSMTVPGMDVPIRETLDRFVRGQEIPIQRNPIYEGHLPEFPDVRTMDKVEKELYARKVRTEIANYQNALQKQENEQKIQNLNQLKSELAEAKNQLSKLSENSETSTKSP